MAKKPTSARSAARADSRKANKRSTEPQEQKSLFASPVFLILILFLAVGGGFLVGRISRAESEEEGAYEGTPVTTGKESFEDLGTLPETFAVDVCRLEKCKEVEVTTSEGFSAALLKLREVLGLPDSSSMSLVNQSGYPITSLVGVYSASEEKGKERGLSSTWRGLKVLLDQEKFFWPLPKSGGRNSSEFGDTYVHYMSDGHRVEVQAVFDSPRIYQISNFLTKRECNHLINRAKEFKKEKKFVDSSVGGDDASKVKSDVRTSTQAWIGPSQSNDDSVFERVRNRASEFLRIGLDLAEDTQIVHYGEKQQYLGHHDYTPAESIPGNPYFAGGGNRVATLLYYLNDVPEGGDTRFPYAQDHPPFPKEHAHYLYNGRACSTGGLGVQPERGKAILFYSLLEDGHMEGVVDPTSIHAACPAGKQEKWLANQWFRNKRVLVNGKWHLYDNIW